MTIGGIEAANERGDREHGRVIVKVPKDGKAGLMEAIFDGLADAPIAASVIAEMRAVIWLA